MCMDGLQCYNNKQCSRKSSYWKKKKDLHLCNKFTILFADFCLRYSVVCSSKIDEETLCCTIYMNCYSVLCKLAVYFAFYQKDSYMNLLWKVKTITKQVILMTRNHW